MMVLSDQDLNRLAEYIRQATPGPWEYGQAETTTIEEHIAWCTDLLKKSTGQELFCVLKARADHEAEDSPLIVAITGNGPTSAANAQFITLARDALPRLLDLALRYRHVLPVLQLCYRKHVQNDDTIGWQELGDRLYTALVEAMGDLEFIEWLEAEEHDP